LDDFHRQPQITSPSHDFSNLLGGRAWNVAVIAHCRHSHIAPPCFALSCGQFGACPSVMFQQHPLRDTFFSRKTFLPRGSAVWHLSPQTSIDGKGLT
jgi:hypothetical protein